MNKISLLLLLFFTACETNPEIFPNSTVDDIDTKIIKETVAYTDSIPISIKVNYGSDFNFSFKSFNTSIYNLDYFFDKNFEIDINSNYDSVLVKNDSIFIGKREGENQFILAIYDTISLVNGLRSNIIHIEDIKSIITEIQSVNENKISTTVIGDSLFIDNSKKLFVKLKQKYETGYINYLIVKKNYSKELMNNLSEFVLNPDTLFSIDLNSDSNKINERKITENSFKDIDFIDDSTKILYSTKSNFFTDSLFAYDSIIVDKKGKYHYVLKNVQNSSFSLEDSNNLSINWIIPNTKSKLDEIVIQNIKSWTLDSIFKINNSGEAFYMLEDNDSYQDTLTIYSTTPIFDKYEYLSKRSGKSYGEAIVKKGKFGIDDSLFVGTKFIYRNIIELNDTVNIFIAHTNFKDYSGVFTNKDKSFYIFDISDDGNINKK